MSVLLHMYPGDAWVFRIGTVLVQITVVILLALVLARAGRSNAAWRHGVHVVALICVLTSPFLTLMMEAGGITLITLRLPESHTVSAVPSPSLPDLPALEPSPGGLSARQRPARPPNGQYTA